MMISSKTRHKFIMTLIAWSVAFVLFFPILWTVLTSFKSEIDAIAIPPKLFGFDWTLASYIEVLEKSDYFGHFINSVILSLGSTILGMIIAIPAAWSMAFVPGKQTKNILLWMLSLIHI